MIDYSTIFLKIRFGSLDSFLTERMHELKMNNLEELEGQKKSFFSVKIHKWPQINAIENEQNYTFQFYRTQGRTIERKIQNDISQKIVGQPSAVARALGYFTLARMQPVHLETICIMSTSCLDKAELKIHRRMRKVRAPKDMVSLIIIIIIFAQRLKLFCHFSFSLVLVHVSFLTQHKSKAVRSMCVRRALK